jgi:hypothetical protein
MTDDRQEAPIPDLPDTTDPTVADEPTDLTTTGDRLARGEAAATEIDGWSDAPAGHREGPAADDDAVREKGGSTQG